MTEKYTYYASGGVKTLQIDDELVYIHQLWTYTEDGSSRSRETDQAVWTETFHANGKVAAMKCKTKAGQKIDDWTYDEYTYDDSGRTLTHYRIRTNGLHMSSTYHSEKAFTMVTTKDGVVIGTEYWVGNDHIGGIDSNGNPYGQTHDTYQGNGGSDNGVGGR